MEPELARRLRALNKEQLILLLEKLTEISTTASAEISSLLTMSATNVTVDNAVDAMPLNANDLILHRAVTRNITPHDLSIYRERVQSYDERLQQGASQQAIFDEVVHFLQGADELLNQDRYLPALEIYELILDARLSQPDGALATIFDRAIDEFLPELDLLLAEASSLMVIDSAQPEAVDTEQIQPLKDVLYNEDTFESSESATHETSKTTTDTLKILKAPGLVKETELHRQQTQSKSPILTPQLSTTKRQSWLVRLFNLWLKRMDMDDHHLDEQILEIIHETMWNEDIPVMRQLILDAIAGSPAIDHSNIVNFSHQSRVRHLEKLLRELSLGPL